MQKIALLGLVMVFGCSQEQDPQSCTSRGDSCSDSYECCGADVCEGWQCVAQEPACGAVGSYCSSNGICCNYRQGTGWCVDNQCKDSCTDNAGCVSGCCAPTTAGVYTCADASYCPQCFPVRTYCTNAVQCCGSMLCDPTMGTCCAQYGQGCGYDNDCCGVMLCRSGTCG